MKISIDVKYKEVIYEALSDYLYKISLELNDLKGQAMTSRRRELTKKQRLLEEVRGELNA